MLGPARYGSVRAQQPARLVQVGLKELEHDVDVLELARLGREHNVLDFDNVRVLQVPQQLHLAKNAHGILQRHRPNASARTELARQAGIQHKWIKRRGTRGRGAHRHVLEDVVDLLDGHLLACLSRATLS